MSFNPDLNRERWTYSAVNCYLNYCDCSRCNIPKITETPCHMRYSVKSLIKQLGLPTRADCNRLGVNYAQLQERQKGILEE